MTAINTEHQDKNKIYFNFQIIIKSTILSIINSQVNLRTKLIAHKQGCY